MDNNNYDFFYGYIDKSGKIVIAPQYDYANDFNEDGVAGVGIGDRHLMIDKTGKEVENYKPKDKNEKEETKYNEIFVTPKNPNITLL